MTIDTGNSLSSYSTASYLSSLLQNGSSTGSSSVSTEPSSELSEEEKLYDTDGDGVLSVTERTTYLQAQAAKKEAETLQSGSESDDKDKRSIEAIKKAWDESSLLRKSIYEKLKPSDDDQTKAMNRVESNEKEDKISFLAQRVLEAYQSHQSADSETISKFDIAV